MALLENHFYGYILLYVSGWVDEVIQYIGSFGFETKIVMNERKFV